MIRHEFLQAMELCLTLVGLGIIGYIIPFLERKQIVFGVRLQAEELEKLSLKRLYSSFRLTYGITMAAYVIAVVTMACVFSAKQVMAVTVIGQIVVIYFLFSVYHRRTLLLRRSGGISVEKPLSAAVVADTHFREKVFRPSLVWFLPAWGLLAAHFALLALTFERLPERIPRYLDLSGEAFELSSKSLLTVMRFPLLSCLALLLLMTAYWIIVAAKQQLDVRRPERSRRQDQLSRQRWLIFLMIFATVLTVYYFLISLHAVEFLVLPELAWEVIHLGFPFVLICSCLGIALSSGQAGSRIKVDVKEKEQPVTAFDDNDSWKLGFLYVNPQDPAVFIEKRLGIGWTINFGNPLGVGILALILALIAVTAFIA